ncbi:ATP-binding protein [Streptomyces apocyni]|uniref:ATP-binding protein n=1 Tax=Streptomyces apocyni TaxID=2654677 RepID=UPI0012EAC243|nr:ATP-binding protein [Streptomyces apocyni]
MPKIDDVYDESWEYTLHIPHDPIAVTVCRQTLRLVLAAHGLAHLTELAELLATELIGNAVRHTKGPAALSVHRSGGTLRICAWDADPTPPAPPPPALALALAPDVDAEQGRGLALVRTWADGWGWHPLASGRDTRKGKYVWCELGAA